MSWRKEEIIRTKFLIAFVLFFIFKDEFEFTAFLDRIGEKQFSNVFRQICKDGADVERRA